MPGHFLNDLRTTFDRHAGRPALVYRNRTWTYAELDAAARRCAGWLQNAGVKSGDRIVLFTAEKLPFLVGHLAAMYAGAAPLPLNPRFTREEMRYFLTDSQARVVIAGSEQQRMIVELSSELPHPPVVLADSIALDPPENTWGEPDPRADDACLILYSSGTTGWPKGVVHTHANVASALHALATCWRMTPDDRVVNVLPLFHIHGLAFATHLTWLTGGCLLVEDAFDPRTTLEAIGRGTVFMAVPPIYYKLLEEPQFRPAAQGWKSVRLFTCGSAPIRPEVLPELQAILGRPVINRYGMTEGYVITSLPLDGPWPDGSVGLPLAGVELQVVGEDGEAVATGEVGAVQIRGPSLFPQYWNKPEATAAAFAGGWFDTGDLGRLDANGFLTLVGRKHDLIITSGYNVYPQVVERVIGECPGVRECAVLGLPDSRRGECVAVAVIKADPTLDESRLMEWWNERLVHYQRPKSVLFVELLPKNALGKVLRRDLRKLFDQ
jgi:malonyl-CoA/methylmalonyl-CoA synthetase